MSSELKDIKIKMLNEFEKEIDDIFNKYFENNIPIGKYTDSMTWLKDVWSQTRVDIKNVGTDKNSIKLNVTDPNIYVSYPIWFNDNSGNGCVIEYENKPVTLEFECINDGEIQLILRGKDFKDINHKRRPILINYRKMKINDEIIFNENHLIWHNKPFIFNRKCKNGEKISLTLESDSIYDYFPTLKNYIENIVKNVQDLNIAKDQIKKFINHEKMLLDVKRIMSDDIIFDNEDSSMLYNSINQSMMLYSLYKSNKKLQKEFTEYKIQTDKILNSYNTLFNSLFIYNKVEAKKLVNDSRELNMQLLDFINNVCEKYGLKWWLHAGTLLGAIRHDGFIPWDDDCDINMIRGDYEKFLEVINDEIKIHGLSDNIEVNTNTITNNNVFLPFIKVNYWIDTHLYAFIDIFPTDYTNKIINNIENIFKQENIRIGQELRKGLNRNEVLEESFDKLNVSKDKTNIIISGVEDPVLSIHSYDSIFPLKLIKFENRMYPCPNNYQEYIISEYGHNYKQIPKVIYNHGFYEYISGHENVYENFENEINKLKKVNENF